jgi:hypothetical protein
MSNDFIVCAICGEARPGHYEFYTCELCSNVFCSWDCSELYSTLNEDGEPNDDIMDCCICRKDKANDYILLEALLRHFNLTREQALEIWQKEPPDAKDEII